MKTGLKVAAAMMVLVCLEMIVLSVASTAPQKTVKSMKRINELHRAIGKSGGKRS